MQEQTQQTEQEQLRITRAAMEEELGDSYKRCWAIAFKNAGELIDFDEQIESLSKEFELLRAQAAWFVNGANSIVFKQEAKHCRDKPEEAQKKLSSFPASPKSRRYVSELEMMSFLEDVEQMCSDVDFADYWQELNEIKQTVTEQSCATEKEVLKIFQIRSMVENDREQKERFFDAYPVSTDAWENGYFDIKGEVVY